MISIESINSPLGNISANSAEPIVYASAFKIGEIFSGIAILVWLRDSPIGSFVISKFIPLWSRISKGSSLGRNYQYFQYESTVDKSGSTQHQHTCFRPFAKSSVFFPINFG